MKQPDTHPSRTPTVRNHVRGTRPFMLYLTSRLKAVLPDKIRYIVCVLSAMALYATDFEGAPRTFTLSKCPYKAREVSFPLYKLTCIFVHSI